MEIHTPHNGTPGPFEVPKTVSQRETIDVEAQEDSGSKASLSKYLPSDLTKATFWQKIAAEMIGTFVLVFAGCGSAMVDAKSHGQVTHLGIAAAFGVAVMVMIYAIGHISGGHINPAITLAFAAVRHFPWDQVPAYICAQVLGGIISGYSLRSVFGRVAYVGAAVPAGSDWQSFALETIITFILMFVISAVATDTRAIGELAGLAIGSTVGLNAIFAGPISGASMNPARSIGSAVAGNHYSSLWLYIVGPILGAVAGALAYNLIRLPDKPEVAPARSRRSFRR